MIRLETTKGNIDIELDFEKTPVTAQNFLDYVNEKFYDGVIFHRVINGFMIQGGGMTEDMSEKKTRKSIQNEADKGGSNVRGSLAMARTMDPHSASAQFFINVVDNAFLNHREKNNSGWGYCVFGRVVSGMDVVDTIKQVATTSRRGHQDVPAEPVVITKAYEIKND